VVQVEPMKLMWKAPGTIRLKLKYDKLLSSFAFKFNLRRYIADLATGERVREILDVVGWCRLTL